jgi:hypothetical protein
MALQQAIGAARRASRSHIHKIVAGAFAVAVTLLPLGARAMESFPKPEANDSASTLPLPPVPYLESMQWMKWKPSPPLFRIDTLLAPSIGPAGSFQVPSEYDRTLSKTLG